MNNYQTFVKRTAFAGLAAIAMTACSAAPAENKLPELSFSEKAITAAQNGTAKIYLIPVTEKNYRDLSINRVVMRELRPEDPSISTNESESLFQYFNHGDYSFSPGSKFAFVDYREDKKIGGLTLDPKNEINYETLIERLLKQDRIIKEYEQLKRIK